MTSSLKKNNPDLSDVLAMHKKDIMLSLNCHAVGIIQSINTVKQTCTATIAYSKTLLERDTSGRYLPVLKDYPILVDVPIVIISGGVGGLTMPIKKGDSALILFNDRDIDRWFSGATSGALTSKRLHSLSDGIALVGLRQTGKAIADYQADKTVLYYGANKISIGADSIICEKGTSKITIGNSTIICEKGAAKITIGTKIKIEVGGQNLGVLIGNLCDAITGNVPLTTGPGSPVNAAAQIAAVTLAKTAIQGVLE